MEPDERIFMPKYKLTIVEITETEAGNPPYNEIQKTIYEQTLERLDVAKVVTAANESIALAQPSRSERLEWSRARPKVFDSSSITGGARESKST